MAIPDSPLGLELLRVLGQEAVEVSDHAKRLDKVPTHLPDGCVEIFTHRQVLLHWRCPGIHHSCVNWLGRYRLKPRANAPAVTPARRSAYRWGVSLCHLVSSSGTSTCQSLKKLWTVNSTWAARRPFW